MQLKDKVVLITGGASGIGKIMVRLMLERQAKVIIWDINQSGIEKTISDFSSLGFIKGFQVDISKLTEIKETAKKVKQEFGSIDVLINNAGIVVGEYFYEHSTSDIIKTMEINATAPMLITAEFLKEMIDKNSGHICNISSSGGIISNQKCRFMQQVSGRLLDGQIACDSR